MVGSIGACPRPGHRARTGRPRADGPIRRYGLRESRRPPESDCTDPAGAGRGRRRARGEHTPAPGGDGRDGGGPGARFGGTQFAALGGTGAAVAYNQQIGGLGGYIDSAIPRSNIRLRYDDAYGNISPRPC